MTTIVILHLTIISGLAAALLRWPGPGSPFWSHGARQPLVLARVRQSTIRRFRETTPG